MTTASVPTGTTRAASTLWNARATILREWDARVRAEMKTPRPLAIADALPPFLDTLAEALALNGRDVRARPFPCTKGGVAETVLEWGILRDVLLGILQAERPLPIEARIVIHRLVDENIRAAAEGALAPPTEVHEISPPSRQSEPEPLSLALEHRNFEHLFQESSQLVATFLGPSHVFESLNPAYVRLLRKDATGMTLRSAQPEAARSGLFELLDRVFETGETIRSREHLVQVPGREGYFNFIVTARRDWDGRVAGVMLLATDITEVVRARQTADFAQRELREFIAQFPSPMCLLHGPDLVFALANAAFVQLCAGDERVLLGRPLREALPEFTGLELAERVFLTGQPLRLIERSIAFTDADGNGETRFLNLLLHPKRTNQNVVDGVIAAVTDVTEQVVARRKVQENEARFRLLAEVLPQIIWEVRPDGELTYSNAYWTTYSGLGARQSQRQHWETAIDPEHREQVRRVWSEAKTNVAPFEMEVRVRRASDGMFRWFLMRGRPVRDTDGAVLKWMVAAMDIHAQKEARSWADAMIDALPNPLWLIEPMTGRILYKSRCASELERHTVPTGVGPEHWADLYPLTDEEDRPLPVERYPAYLAAQGDFSQHEAVWHAPIGRVSFLSRSAMIPACFGRPATVAFMIQDVSTLKKTERALRAAVASRDEFLSIASHELKTPLTSIRLLTQGAKRRLALGREPIFSSERLASFVEQTDRSVQRLTRLVDDMLDASRISTGRLTYHFETMDLGAIVEEAAERLRPQADGQLVSIFVERSASFESFGDRLRIDQVVTNLLTNGLRYGRGTPIRAVVRRTETEAILEVSDEGPGVAPEFRERIFKRFERLPSSDSVGLGLGLFICREIVEHHGGVIFVDDSFTHGARFMVRLPLRFSAPS